VSTSVALRQCLQQRLGILEIGRVEALGEPAVDRRQQVVSLLALTLLLPQASEAHGSTEFQRPGLLQTIVYLAYRTRVVEGSPSNSISSVPVMPWQGP
jgi:CreA protein